MSKSEGSGGKAVEDRGVDLCVVLGAQAVGQGKDIQLCHEVCSNHHRQPLVVGDVLEEIQVGLNLILSVKRRTCISAMRILRASW